MLHLRDALRRDCRVRPRVVLGCVERQAALLAGDFPYGDCGLLDRTHLRFFTYESATALLQSVGLIVTDVERVIGRLVGPSPDFEDLMLLRELDTKGRVQGAIVGTVDEALDYLKELSRANEGE